MPQELRDLSDNTLANATTPSTPVLFTPEAGNLAGGTLPDADGEQFTTLDLYDATRSSAEWGSGKLTRGYGGAVPNVCAATPQSALASVSTDVRRCTDGDPGVPPVTVLQSTETSFAVGGESGSSVQGVAPQLGVHSPAVISVWSWPRKVIDEPMMLVNAAASW